MKERIKVLWICHFSDERTRMKLKLDRYYYHKIIRKILGKNTNVFSDFAVWNSNAIKCFEKFDDIDLTVLFPHSGIEGRIQRFEINGINYIAFRSENDFFLNFLKERVLGTHEESFVRNRALITTVIQEIKPDIVHFIGAENEYYSIAALDVPQSIPSVVSLQTLLSRQDFSQNYYASKKWYDYHSRLEKQILRKCTYIGSRTEQFKSIIWKSINPNAIFLQMPLALGVDIDTSCSSKEFDFVYFAKDISKAADEAIEAFSIAHNEIPRLTLNISGSFSKSFRTQLDKRINELGLINSVFITGEKSTHVQVIEQIKKSRFALLPLKVDLISGTIREAMACGLPVVSTITPSTPKLNIERESILLSKSGDYQGMANNMLRLVNDEHYAATIRENAILTVGERYSNERFMQMWRKAYYEIIDNFSKGTPFSDDVISK